MGSGNVRTTKKNSPMVRNSNKTIPKSITMDTIIINITTKIGDY